MERTPPVRFGFNIDNMVSDCHHSGNRQVLIMIKVTSASRLFLFPSMGSMNVGQLQPGEWKEIQSINSPERKQSLY
ncbi:hypothetical protein O9993_18380 [Vibrio lentus]|nr:hypothetical protein [Vibrio lentus]